MGTATVLKIVRLLNGVCLFSRFIFCFVFNQIPPQSLAELNIPVYRLEQRCGEFLVTLPGACTSSVSCGYNVAESIHYATPTWIPAGIQAFKVSKAVSELVAMATTVAWGVTKVFLYFNAWRRGHPVVAVAANSDTA